MEPPTEIQVKTRMETFALILSPCPDLYRLIEGPRNRLRISHFSNRLELLLKKYNAATAKGKVGRIGSIAPTIPTPENNIPNDINSVRFIAE